MTIYYLVWFFSFQSFESMAAAAVRWTIVERCKRSDRANLCQFDSWLTDLFGKWWNVNWKCVQVFFSVVTSQTHHQFQLWHIWCHQSLLQLRSFGIYSKWMGTAHKHTVKRRKGLMKDIPINVYSDAAAAVAAANTIQTKSNRASGNRILVYIIYLVLIPSN